jgi:hypothetical protein
LAIQSARKACDEDRKANKEADGSANDHDKSHAGDHEQGLVAQDEASNSGRHHDAAAEGGARHCVSLIPGPASLPDLGGQNIEEAEILVCDLCHVPHQAAAAASTHHTHVDS